MEFVCDGVENIAKKEGMLVTNIFSSFHNVFRSPFVSGGGGEGVFNTGDHMQEKHLKYQPIV